jgi:CHASE2 domain-containing sensor protein
MRGRALLVVVGAASGLGAGLLAAWLCNPANSAGLLGQSLYRAELSVYDYRLARAPSPGRSDEIVIVEMDEGSFSQPQLNIWPWPRRFHAKVLRNLAEAGAGVIGVDMILGGTSSNMECPPGQDP